MGWVIRSGWARAAMILAVVLVAMAATFLRQEGIPKAQTVWAEDGPVFARCAEERSLLSCLGEPYAGYFHTVPRLAAAAVVELGEPTGLPFRLTLAAAMLAAAAAILAARAVADASGSSLAGLLAGAALVLVFPAGMEVLGNLTNLHWILFAAAATVLLCAWMGRATGPADILLVALAALSSPFAVLLPVLAVGGVVARSRRAIPCLVVAMVATLPQLAMMLTNERTWAPIEVAVQPWDSFTWAAREAWFGPGSGGLKVVLLVLSLAAVVALIASVRMDRAGAIRSLLTVAGFVLTAAAALAISQLRNGALGYRHVLPAAALTVIAVAFGVASVVRIQAARTVGSFVSGRTLRVGAALVILLPVALFGIGFARSFRMTSLASTGPDAVAGIEAGHARCTVGTAAVEVAISPFLDPPAWFLPIRCAHLRPDP